MKTRSMLGLSLGVCILFAGQAAFADQGNGKALGKSAPGVQVHIDRQTGKKIAPDDSALAELAAQPEQGLDTVAAATGMPLESEAAQHNADGSMSAKVGLRDMKYAVMSIGKDGSKTITHKSIDDLTTEMTVDAEEAGEK